MRPYMESSLMSAAEECPMSAWRSSGTGDPTPENVRDWARQSVQTAIPLLCTRVVTTTRHKTAQHLSPFLGDRGSPWTVLCSAGHQGRSFLLDSMYSNSRSGVNVREWDPVSKVIACLSGSQDERQNKPSRTRSHTDGS